MSDALTTDEIAILRGLASYAEGRGQFWNEAWPMRLHPLMTWRQDGNAPYRYWRNATGDAVLATLDDQSSPLPCADDNQESRESHIETPPEGLDEVDGSVTLRGWTQDSFGERSWLWVEGGNCGMPLPNIGDREVEITIRPLDTPPGGQG